MKRQKLRKQARRVLAKALKGAKSKKRRADIALQILRLEPAEGSE